MSCFRVARYGQSMRLGGQINEMTIDQLAFVPSHRLYGNVSILAEDAVWPASRSESAESFDLKAAFRIVAIIPQVRRT